MRLTKTYSNGTVTLDASQFGINQEVLDIEIRNSEPIKAAVERLKELEDRNESRKVIKTILCSQACPVCKFPARDKFCGRCGQALDWSEACG